LQQDLTTILCFVFYNCCIINCEREPAILNWNKDEFQSSEALIAPTTSKTADSAHEDGTDCVGDVFHSDDATVSKPLQLLSSLAQVSDKNPGPTTILTSTMSSYKCASKQTKRLIEAKDESPGQHPAGKLQPETTCISGQLTFTHSVIFSDASEASFRQQREK